jgi:hypothetical protein
MAAAAVTGGMAVKVGPDLSGASQKTSRNHILHSDACVSEVTKSWFVSLFIVNGKSKKKKKELP